jgi:hypothetical protein
MDDAVFLLRGSAMTALRHAPYDSEALLQKALADFPEVIAGPTTVGDSPVGLLLVRQEMGVPKVEGGSAAFRLDHLFVDADAVPVLVEVKRSTDTRIRREVVGQMLDYVANAVAYWPIEQMRADFELSSGGPVAADQKVTDLGGDRGVEEFWKQVETNLRDGRVRMLFVADALPAELVRVIEFLNEQMSPAEVLGVELRQYVSGPVGDPHTVYVPRVVGRTTAAVATKIRSTGGRLWDRGSLLESASATAGGAAAELLRQILDDAEQRGTTLRWGRGATASVGGWELIGGQPVRTWIVQLGRGVAGDPSRLELELKKVAQALEDTARIEAAADVLGQIPPAAHRLEEARALNWLIGKRFPIEELLTHPESIELVLRTLRLLADPAPAVATAGAAG